MTGFTRNGGGILAVFLLAALTGLAGCGTAEAEATPLTPAPVPTTAPQGSAGQDGEGTPAQAGSSLSAPAQLGADGQVLSAIPGLGPETLGQIGEETRQVLVSSSAEQHSDNASTTYYERHEDGWVQRAHWRGHNGSAGWLEDRREGDRTTPVGVFALTDAGGYLEDPGAKLPYTQESGYREAATTVYGDDMENVFNYVIAINYNRVEGTPPTDSERPDGWERGGGIWLHVDHGKGTRGCVTIPQEGMEFLLRELDPEQHPLMVMGSFDDLAR
ncbi:L,D-transpeptidase family protein [Sediminivirga luteola]|uniref:L,D-transpeptidase family protein n=1 Tax=Sediminivirga luteola TaxID=1774748 RepID=UPI001F56F963|nr:L,D-transpeptidase family protein [Sediminivirga luteola]MCI2266215.1 L,D-transpeptidase family protein [Sediminivirga luteola]